METSSLNDKIIQDCRKLQPYLVEVRQYLHQHPETMFAETKTSRFIKKELEKMGYIVVKTAGTGLICTLDGHKRGKIVALRADMDGLNLQEENNVPYKSLNKGKMHGCGHDAHMACLLGAAKVLRYYQEELSGTIKFIFQPAEEGGGGAKFVTEDGHLEDVDEIYGLHVWGDFPTGEIFTRKGGLLASASTFTINIKGKGGHAALPHKAVDPTNVIIEIYNAFQKLVTREVNPVEPVVITTPQFVGSHTFNVIPGDASLSGTLRTFNAETKKYLIRRMEEITVKYAEAWGCVGKFNLIEIDYPPVVNDPMVIDRVKELLSPLGDVNEMAPLMGGEDFAFYLEKVKGAFVFLGARNEEKGIIYPNHHPKFDIDEDILWKGTAILSLLGMH